MTLTNPEKAKLPDKKTYQSVLEMVKDLTSRDFAKKFEKRLKVKARRARRK